jgi:hypothetical protein
MQLFQSSVQELGVRSMELPLSMYLYVSPTWLLLDFCYTETITHGLLLYMSIACI